MSVSGIGQSLSDLDFITEILALFTVDSHSAEDLEWTYRDGALRFFVDCSDTFDWASADAEPVASDEDLAALKQAHADADHLEGGWLWPTLYCARKREMRPMNAWMKKNVGADNEGDLRLLFEAAGPPRESVFGAP